MQIYKAKKDSNINNWKGKQTVVPQARSTHSFQALNETAQEAQAHLARARWSTAEGDPLLSLKSRLFLSHQWLQMVAKKDNCHNGAHFEETKAMSQEKDDSAIDDSITQDTPNWSSTKNQTFEENRQCRRRWFDSSDACKHNGQALTMIRPRLRRLSCVMIFPNVAVQTKQTARRGAFEDHIFGLTVAVPENDDDQV